MSHVPLQPCAPPPRNSPLLTSSSLPPPPPSLSLSPCPPARQPFTRFVEVGRVALINYGPDAGKLATILEIIDGKRVLIDGPQSITGVHRQPILLKRLSLTDLVVDKLPRNATQKNLVKGWTAQGVKAKWDATAWAKKLDNKKKRAALGDFGRFKVQVAKKELSKAVATGLKK